MGNTTVDGSVKLWRYFSLPKLLHLLQSNALYFARIDQFDDPFEGFQTSAEYVEARRSTDIVRRVMDAVVTVSLRSATYVNCWSQFNFENASMWKTYGTDSGGVLIQTCFDKLRRALPSGVSLSSVRYVSDDFNDNLSSDLKARVFRKLQCFSHEMEVRAVILDDTATLRDIMDGHTDKGKIVPIGLGLQNLVERIVNTANRPDVDSWNRKGRFEQVRHLWRSAWLFHTFGQFKTLAQAI